MHHHFSPANQLMHEVKLLSAEIHQGTPHSFLRWYRDGSMMFVSSASGSLLLTVDFVNGTVEVPKWKCERDGLDRTQPMPKKWDRLHSGSMFTTEGNAVSPEDFEWSMSQEEWMKSKVVM